MRKISFFCLALSIGFVNNGFAQLSDDLLVKGLGYFTEIKSASSEIKASNDDCTFSPSEIASIYELAMEYNFEVALKGGNITPDAIDAGNINVQEMAKKAETDKKDSNKSTKKKEKEAEKGVKTTGYIVLPAPNEFSTKFYTENSLVRKTATTLMQSWSGSLTNDEKKILLKATNNTCSFKQVKVWSGVLDKVLKEGGIPGLKNVNQMLQGAESPSDAGMQLLQNSDIMEKLVK